MPEMGAPTSPTAAPNAPNPGANDNSSEAQSAAGDAIQQIQNGFQQLAKMLSSAKGQVDENCVKLFQRAVQATDDFLEDITGGGDGDEAREPQAKGPMPANAKRNAPPAQYT